MDRQLSEAAAKYHAARRALEQNRRDSTGGGTRCGSYIHVSNLERTSYTKMDCLLEPGHDGMHLISTRVGDVEWPNCASPKTFAQRILRGVRVLLSKGLPK